jgi:hypothetical protein
MIPPCRCWIRTVLASLIATSRRLGLDLFTYLRDVFARISTHPQNQLDELLPDRWAALMALSV